PPPPVVPALPVVSMSLPQLAALPSVAAMPTRKAARFIDNSLGFRPHAHAGSGDDNKTARLEREELLDLREQRVALRLDLASRPGRAGADVLVNLHLPGDEHRGDPLGRAR